MLAFAGLEPSVIESGTLQSNGKMVKHGFGHLRYTIINSTMSILRFSPTLLYTIYYTEFLIILQTIFYLIFAIYLLLFFQF